MRSALRGFTRVLPRLVAAAALAFASLGGTAVLAATFTVVNPYASGLSDADIRIGTLIVFGDSYSAANRRTFHNWAERLRFDDLEVAILADFAKSGATAGVYPNQTNDFKHQVTRWLNTAPTFGPKDLTVVYLGYNDIDRAIDPAGADLPAAMGYYQAALKRVIMAGANGARRHILLVMPHDWGRSPFYVGDVTSRSTYRQRTQVWDSLVAGTAQGFSANLVAVDLFTAMECVFDDPVAFGFTNVTNRRPAKGDPAKYLYDSGTSGLFHFGARGQQLIEQVIQYYLTRGWDWSNTNKDPNTAKQQLITDLVNGQVFPGINCPPPPASAVAEVPIPRTPTLPDLEADPSHFGVAWTRHLLEAMLRDLKADPARFGVAWTQHLLERKTAGMPVPH